MTRKAKSDMSYSDTFRRVHLTLQEVADSVHASILCIRMRNDAMADRLGIDQQECTDGVVLSSRGAFLRHDDRYAILEYRKQTGCKVEWMMVHPSVTENTH